MATAIWSGVLLGEEHDVPSARRGSTGRTVAVSVKTVKPEAPPLSRVGRFGLTRDDYHYIAQVPNVRQAVPIREVKREARNGDRVVDVLLVGTTPAFAEIHAIRVVRGRFLVDKDVGKLNNVAVIGRGTARRLFLGEDPIGKSIRIGSTYFLVVGETLRGDAPGSEEDVPMLRAFNLEVYIPVSTMRARLGDRELITESGFLEREHFELSRIEVIVDDPAKVETTAERIRRLLNRLHEQPDYSVEVVR